MNKYLMPDISKDSIDDLSGGFFAEKGIKAVFLDIDNTLVTPKTKEPDERAKRFIDSLKEAGIKIFLVSNNSKKRVSAFNTGNFPAISRAGKPFTFAYRRLIKKYGLKKEEVASVGDQFYSDILASRRLGILSVYVSPIEIGNEGPFVHIKRRMEQRVLAELKRK